MEAKYVANIKATKEAVWLRKFLIDQRVVPAGQSTVTLYCDNSRVVAN